MLSTTIKKQVFLFIQQFFSHFNYKIEKTDEHTQLVCSKTAVPHIEDKFLLLLSWRNSGTTAIGKFICNSENISSLVPNCEGIELALPIRHFNPDKYLNYDRLIKVWSAKINQIKQNIPEMEYIFEKSHMHVFYYKKLLKFIPNTRMVASNRNPYAQIASSLRGYDLLNDKNEQCRMHIHEWLTRSKCIKEICEKENVPLVTYEQFCNDPHRIISAFELEKSEFKVDSYISGVKNYPAQAITNMNDKQIAFLSGEQREIITNTLSEHKELLAYFGYELMS